MFLCRCFVKSSTGVRLYVAYSESNFYLHGSNLLVGVTSKQMASTKASDRSKSNAGKDGGNTGKEGDLPKEEFEFFFGIKCTFSQFHPAKFSVDGITYNCMEQYMHHQKAVTFDDKAHAVDIMKTDDPKRHKKLGRQVGNFDKAVWGRKSVAVVKKGSLAKYRQNSEMKQILFATYPKTLVEASPRDRLWGIGMGKSNPKALSRSTWRGKNLLGDTLTDVRNKMMLEEGLIHEFPASYAPQSGNPTSVTAVKEQNQAKAISSKMKVVSVQTYTSSKVKTLGEDKDYLPSKKKIDVHFDKEETPSKKRKANTDTEEHTPPKKTKADAECLSSKRKKINVHFDEEGTPSKKGKANKNAEEHTQLENKKTTADIKTGDTQSKESKTNSDRKGTASKQSKEKIVGTETLSGNKEGPKREDTPSKKSQIKTDKKDIASKEILAKMDMENILSKHEQEEHKLSMKTKTEKDLFHEDDTTSSTTGEKHDEHNSPTEQTLEKPSTTEKNKHHTHSSSKHKHHKHHKHSSPKHIHHKHSCSRKHKREEGADSKKKASDKDTPSIVNYLTVKSGKEEDQDYIEIKSNKEKDVSGGT